MILAPRGSLGRTEPQAGMEYPAYQVCQASRVTVDRASQVKRGYQDFLVKRATVVQLAPQELGCRDLLDLVGFLEIKESMDYQGNKASLGFLVTAAAGRALVKET